MSLFLLKFGTNIRYDRLYCVLKNQPHMAFQSIYLSIFLSFQHFFHLIAQHLLVLQSSNFAYTMRTTKCNTVNKTKVLRFILPSFSVLPFSSPIGELMAYPWSGCCSQFQTSSPLKSLRQSKPNFISSLLGKGKFV